MVKQKSLSVHAEVFVEWGFPVDREGRVANLTASFILGLMGSAREWLRFVGVSKNLRVSIH